MIEGSEDRGTKGTRSYMLLARLEVSVLSTLEGADCVRSHSKQVGEAYRMRYQRYIVHHGYHRLAINSSRLTPHRLSQPDQT